MKINLKTLTAAFVLSATIYPQAWAEIITGSDCNGECGVHNVVIYAKFA